MDPGKTYVFCVDQWETLDRNQIIIYNVDNKGFVSAMRE